MDLTGSEKWISGKRVDTSETSIQVPGKARQQCQVRLGETIFILEEDFGLLHCCSQMGSGEVQC